MEVGTLFSIEVLAHAATVHNDHFHSQELFVYTELVLELLTSTKYKTSKLFSRIIQRGKMAVNYSFTSTEV